METKYLDLDKPPVCLHILGQSLVNSIFLEGKELQKQLTEAQRYIQELERKITTL